MERKKADDFNARMLSLDGLMRYCSVGRHTAEKIGKNANAVIKIGRRVIYDREMIDAYLTQCIRKGGE